MKEPLESNRRIEHKLDTFITNQQVQPMSLTAQEDGEEISFISLLPLGVEDFVKFDFKKFLRVVFQKKDLYLPTLQRASSEAHFKSLLDLIKHPSALLLPLASSHQKTISECLSEALPVTKARINNMQPTRNKGLVVTFQTNLDKQILQKEITEHEALREEIYFTNPSKRHPSLINYNIPKKFSESAIQLGLKSFMSNQQELRVRFKFKGKDSASQN
ncbi:hypothetical protein AVEN_35624-1 [Araneus ventricosus]|uniref:Uncharacterized protein n=1 Tax=Araneus ventricosus TaxID=182803 RepID=A0A4Y2SZQ6_ARAVE|nr:hypothetical protein AVEN_35624-1 [Araneus ventricosus]